MSTEQEQLDEDAALEAAMLAEDQAHGRTEAPSEGDEPEQEAETAEGKPTTEPAAAATAEGTPAETVEAAEPAKPAGVASKDGKTVLPYAALKGARAETKHERALRTQAESERDALKQQLADIKAGKAPTDADGNELTDEYLQEVAADFPQLAPLVKAVQRGAKAAPAAEPAQAQEPDGEDPLQEAIDSVPLLAAWQAEDPEKWARATKIDRALEDSPKWKGKPLAERFAHVAKQVADEFDIPVQDAPSQKTPTKARQEPEKVIQGAARNAPNTLSDFKGGATDPTRDSIDRMPAASQLNRAMQMSDAEIDKWLAKVG